MAPSASKKRESTQKPLDYLAQVELPNIGNTYTVKVFLGDISSNPQDWPTDPNFAGQGARLMSPNMNSDLLVTAKIPLTQRLYERYQSGELKALDQDSVLDYMKSNLHWRIQNLVWASLSLIRSFRIGLFLACRGIWLIL